MIFYCSLLPRAEFGLKNIYKPISFDKRETLKMVKREPVKIILDLTPLKNGFYADASRSGIFFTVRNILSQLLQRNDIELYFNITCSEPDTFVKTMLVAEREFPQHLQFISSRLVSNSGIFSKGINALFYAVLAGKGRYKNSFIGNFFRIANFTLGKTVNLFKLHYSDKIREKHEISDCNFLSLMYAVPEHIKQIIPSEKRFTMLYDAIPTICAGVVSENPWYNEVVATLSADENYFAISKATADDFKRLFPILSNLEIPVVPLASAECFNSVKNDELAKNIRKKYNISSDKKIVFSHCSLAPHKNLERLLRAFVSFNKENKQYQMVFGGANAGRSKDKLFAELGIADSSSIIFTGYIDDEELPELYRMADIFCFVSLYEGFGLPVLEAISCGTPCLASSTSSIPEVAGNAALLVDPYDEKAITAGLERLANSPELRSSLREHGLKRATMFSWSNTADSIVAHIAAH